MSDSTERDWLIVGQVAKPHGVHGEVLVEIITDFPERMSPGTRFGLGSEAGPDSFWEVHGVRTHRGRWLLAVRDLRDRDSIEGWRGLYVFLPEQTRDELPEGYYYEHDLVGLECRSPEGEVLGEVAGLDPSGGQPRVVVRRDRRQYLVPWVPEIVVDVDLEGGFVVVRPVPGLLDDDADLV